MTLDEAIEQFKYDAECNRADLDLSYAEDNDQVAEWLEDYKHIKQWKSDIMDEFCKYDVNSFEELVTNARNKAIDDFATKICEVLEEYQTGFNMVSMANIWHFSKELAEQLKAGVENEYRSRKVCGLFD